MTFPENNQNDIEFLMKTGKYAEALALLMKESIEIANIGAWDQILQNLNLQSECNWRMGKIQEAINCAELALNISKSLPQKVHPEIANSYNHLGACYNKMGKLGQAIQYHQQSLELKLMIYGDNHPITANSYNNLGLCYRAIGDFSNALSFHFKALNIREKVFGKYHVSTARSYHNLGSCFDDKGDYAQALHYKQLSYQIKLKEWGENHPGTAIALHTLGVSCHLLKKYHEAIEYFKKALTIKLAIHNEVHHETALTCYNLGICCQHLGLYSTAIDYYHWALSIWEKSFGGQSSKTGMCCRNLAEVYFVLNRFAQTHEYLQKSLYALGLDISVSQIYRLPELTNYNSAIQLFETLTLKANVHYSLYSNSEEFLDLATSLAYFQCADELIDKIRQSFKIEDSKLSLAGNAKTKVYNKALEVIHTIAQDFHNSEKGTLKNLIQSINKDYGYHLPINLMDLAFYFTEKSKSILLYEGIKEAEAKAKAYIPEELRTEEDQLRHQLTYLERCISEINENDLNPSVTDRLADLRSSYFDAKKIYESLIERLEVEYPEYYRLKFDLTIAGINQIQAALPPETGMISYMLTDQLLCAFLITPTQKYWTFQTLPDDFHRLASDFSYTFQPFEENNYLNYSYTLYSCLLKKLIKSGKLKQINRLIIVPDGVIHKIPFEALLTKKCTEDISFKKLPYLLNQFMISYHYSATLWHQQNQSAKTEQVFKELVSMFEPNNSKLSGEFIGIAPVYSAQINRPDIDETDLLFETDSNIRPGNEQLQSKHRIEYLESAGVLRSNIEGKPYQELLYTEMEVQKAGHLFAKKNRSGRVLIHHSATLDNFKALAGQYKYVLIAAHADVDDDKPSKTGIIFSPNTGDGKTLFSMKDAYNLQLNAEVVVLSCCETGIGEIKHGEGTMALNRGFLYSGAKNVVYTLFKVYDKESCELTTLFFKYLLSGYSVAEALRFSKLRLIYKGLKPIKWAGYVVIGE
ncbi:MAG: CHAT domain-containing protein [Sphingobacteriales bacterium]|nr:MAG: CHAT domain-containing protein [Sphingobacteriales bacterium]